MKGRILYLVGQLAAGGLERQLYFLLQGMDREHYQPAADGVVISHPQSTNFYGCTIGTRLSIRTVSDLPRTGSHRPSFVAIPDALTRSSLSW